MVSKEYKITLIALIVSIVVAGVLGYHYYQKYQFQGIGFVYLLAILVIFLFAAVPIIISDFTKAKKKSHPPRRRISRHC